MEIIQLNAEELKDPTGILPGHRYEVMIEIEVPEDDELYTPSGMYIKGIYVREEASSKLAQYAIIERGSETYLDFALEEEEEQALVAYCDEKI